MTKNKLKAEWFTKKKVSFQVAKSVFKLIKQVLRGL